MSLSFKMKNKNLFSLYIYFKGKIFSQVICLDIYILTLYLYVSLIYSKFVNQFNQTYRN